MMELCIPKNKSIKREIKDIDIIFFSIWQNNTLKKFAKTLYDPFFSDLPKTFQSLGKSTAIFCHINDINKDTINADTLANTTASTSFNIENLPANIPLSFLAIVIDNSTGEMLTSGCNEHDAIGAGSSLEIEIILPKTE